MLTYSNCDKSATKHASGNQTKKRADILPSGIAIPALPAQLHEPSDTTQTSTYEISGFTEHTLAIRAGAGPTTSGLSPD